MNLIIPLRDFSPSNNLELKYMLRGVEKYLPDATIHIITKYYPKGLTGINHIPYLDAQGKEYNLMKKLLAGLKALEDNKFIFMADDHFLLQPVTEFPYYFKGAISDEIIKRKPNDTFRQTLENTLAVFNNWQMMYGDDKFPKLPIKNFDMHCPIVFDKKEFIMIMTSLNWNKPQGFGIRSIYCNMLGIEGEFYPDLKIDKPLNYSEIAEKIEKRRFFSTADNAVNDDMKLMLDMLYPLPSKYEKTK